jgi:hypothetical protein
MSKFQALVDDRLPDAGRPKAFSWSTVTQSISQAKTQYDAGGTKGQVRKRFHTVCDVLENHSNMLKILPQGDKYTSLICGSVETIIQVSCKADMYCEHTIHFAL